MAVRSDPERPWTVERALRELPPGALWEIDEGRLVAREPAGFYPHGEAAMRAGARIFAFVETHGLGRVATAASLVGPTRCGRPTWRS